MNILFLFLRHSENQNDSTLTKDISDEFARNGHNVFIATLLERKEGRETQLKLENGYKVLRVKTGNYFDSPGKIEKGITALTMPKDLKKGIIKYLGNEKIDLIFTHTPFISNAKLINSLKEYFSCKAILHLWDIFPQNAKDLEMIKNKFLYNFFEKKERKMYKSFDYIGCMSNGNREYMKINREYIESKKCFLLKNWDKTKEKLDVDKVKIRKKYKLENSNFIAIFGGNMGKPQKLENVLELAESLKEKQNIIFLFVGKGTEKEKLKQIKVDKKLENVRFIDYVPREDYEKLTASCDLGLVSLDERFTVPNFPSKTTDYFKLELPILASLDSCALNDYGIFLEKEVRGGLVAKAGNVEELKEKLLKLYNDKVLRLQLGKNGRKYYEEELGVDGAYKTIMDKINGR